jgi:choline-glycine betaine transporter
MPHEELGLITLLYLLLSNLTVLILAGGAFFLFMLLSGYKSITVKLRKDKEHKKLHKQKHSQEQQYLNRLEKNVKKKNR